MLLYRAMHNIKKVFISLNFVDKYPAMKLHPSIIRDMAVVGSSPTTSFGSVAQLVGHHL